MTENQSLLDPFKNKMNPGSEFTPDQSDSFDIPEEIEEIIGIILDALGDKV